MKPPRGGIEVSGKKELYIPHGSDETLSHTSYLLQNKFLYIPHGSDETHIRILKTVYLVESFISHTVQMKPVIGHQTTKEFIALYPTRFRWNIVIVFQILQRLPDFISHTVQMKQGVEFLQWDIHRCFISHTVQMKRGSCYINSRSAYSLYPTRFRWNEKYIDSFYEKTFTLYPTRFRWNAKRRSCLFLHSCFISHTVQMKQMNCLNATQTYHNFISHTVQMKPEITTPNTI